MISHDRGSETETVIFDRVSFRRNQNDIDPYPTLGGAIYAMPLAPVDSTSTGTDRTVRIRDCTFEDNASDYGGAIYCDGCVLDIIHSSFSGNYATTSGGAIYIAEKESALSVQDSSFQNNDVLEHSYGREVLREDASPIEQDLYFAFSSTINGGGAISAESVENVTVLNTSFFSNRAPSGGAISLKLDAVDLYGRHNKISVGIEKCIFEENQATSVEESDFDDPEDNLGGAVYFISSSTNVEQFYLAESFFKNNCGQYGGGLHVVAMKSTYVTISGCTFEQNRAVKAGGAALFRNNGRIRLTDTKWKSNASGLGGAIMLTNAARLDAYPQTTAMNHIPERRNIFVGNIAQNGGGLACVGCHGLLLRNVEFVKNKATKSGGGLYVLDSAQDSNIEQSSFQNNVATYGGGVALRATANVQFSAARQGWMNVFANNTAVSGGGLFVEGNRHKENTLQVSLFPLQTLHGHQLW